MDRKSTFEAESELLDRPLLHADVDAADAERGSAPGSPAGKSAPAPRQLGAAGVALIKSFEGLHAGGKVLPGLVRRRRAEAALYATA